MVSGFLAARSGRGHEPAQISLNLRNPDVSTVIENAKGKQQPHDDANHHDDVENLLIFPSIGM
jgi:hypothetical protein